MPVLAFLAALTLASPTAPAAAALGPAEEVVESAMVKISVEDGDRKLKHPGYEVYLDEEAIIEMRSGNDRHVVSVVLQKPDGAKKYSVKVAYKRNGKPVISGALELGAKATGTLTKGSIKLSIMVDPAGRPDGRDKIEGPEGDDPLDGAPGG